MAIIESEFDSERELDEWVSANLDSFIPGAIYLPPKQITTTSGKRSLPDGFAFNLQDRE